MSRCDSAAIVAKTSELLPDPETPVKAVSRRLGSSTLRSLRLFSRAPCTRIRSWRSAVCTSAPRGARDELTPGVGMGVPEVVRYAGDRLEGGPRHERGQLLQRPAGPDVVASRDDPHGDLGVGQAPP